MGTGDWNDGMNRVGAKGMGESVWLGWFLHTTLAQWAPIAEARGDTDRARSWREHLPALGRALEASGWDGDWYRRAELDGGTPLRAAEKDACGNGSIARNGAQCSGWC